MNLLQDIQKKAVKRVPTIKPGYTVRVHQKIKEGGKERIQVFEGLVISVNSGHGADRSFRVRKVVQNIGVEKVFPLYSPTINKIEVKKKSKVRRSKLYYMRERAGKSARLKETFVSDKEREEAIEQLAEQKAEEEAKEKGAEENEVKTEAETQKTEEESTPEQKKESPVEKTEEKASEQPKEEAKKE